MGVLDDAIREHLELKRQHGASEEELRRQEEEALGPVRRDVTSQADEGAVGTGEEALEAPETVVEGSGGAATEAPSVPFDGDALPADLAPDSGESEHSGEPASLDEVGLFRESASLDEPAPFPEEDAPVIRRAREPAEPLPDAEGPEEAPDFPPDPEAEAPDYPPEPEREPEPDPEAPDYQPEPTDHAIERDATDGAPRSAPPTDELGDDEPDSGEHGDLLEDTPDFLEETPEHDRLWFEQKPPRDFDFD
jgi:hypothetical protein